MTQDFCQGFSWCTINFSSVPDQDDFVISIIFNIFVYISFPVSPFINILLVTSESCTSLLQCNRWRILKVWWHAATLFCFFLISYITFIQYDPSHSLNSIFLIAVRSKEGLHCGAEPRIELESSVLPSELRRTLVWATPHPSLSFAAPWGITQ